MNLFDHNDNFEQFLREATENFKMRPSVRVWNSVYNNIHPSKKSPSAAALLVFIIAFFIFSSNNSNVFQEAIAIENKSTELIKNKQPLAYSNKLQTPSVYKKQDLYHAAIENKPNGQIKRKTNSVASAPAAIENYKPIIFTNINAKSQLQDFNLHQQINQLDAGTVYQINSIEQKPIYIPVKNNDESELSYQLYATSSVGYRNGYRNSESEISTSSSEYLHNVTDLNKNLRYMPEFNVEAGGAFLVNVTSSLRLKAGMQLNYTNYKLTNNDGLSDLVNSEVSNPVVNNPSQANEIQMLNPNMNNEFKKFNSSTYQISIPFGTELELIGNHQLKWFAGATIQPSYLVGGYPGQNTNEMQSYLQEGYGFRKWNVNTSFETFLSYKLPNGSRINAGPQFRYQLFSSYESKYLYNDKQYNIGLKLGISRNF